jgi:hypothetical protein
VLSRSKQGEKEVVVVPEFLSWNIEQEIRYDINNISDTDPRFPEILKKTFILSSLIWSWVLLKIKNLRFGLHKNSFQIV